MIILLIDVILISDSIRKRLNRQGTKSAKAFCTNRVHQPIDRWLVLRFEQRAHTLRATESLAHDLNFKYMKVCGMDSIFIFFFRQDEPVFAEASPWHAGLSGIFSPAAKSLSAEGRIILTILLILSKCFL
ncbi:MAG: hypothetical protein P8X90_16055 [Desulfobacterales bacterium]